MHLRAELDAPVPVPDLFGWVGALDRYPAWLDIVRSARPVDEPASGGTGASGGTDGSGGTGGTGRAGEATEPAWDVVLVGRLGPLRRSKRLRMVRVEHGPPNRARFVREERDGRDHARWDLAVEVTPAPRGSHLTMDLTYSGSLWGPALHRLISTEIEAAKPRLVALAQGEAGESRRNEREGGSAA